MQKKILFYTDTPISGGAEKHMHLLAKNLSREKFKVKIICSAYESLNNWVKEIETDKIQVIRLKVRHKHDPRHFLLVKNILKTEKPDIFHIHLWNPGAARYAFLAAASEKIKVIATEHDPFPLTGLKRIIKKKTLKKTHHTITVSADNERKMLEWYPELKNKISVVPNGIDLKKFNKDIKDFNENAKQKIITELFQGKPEDFIILSIAALHPRKGLKYLIDAFYKIQEKKKNLRLIIIGEGPEKHELEKQIERLKLSSSTKILPFQKNIPTILKSSDLFVLPSIKEAFGLVILEAMAAKLPIIASKVGGIPEIVEDKKSAILIKPAKSQILGGKILECLENKGLCKLIASNGNAHVKEFDYPKMIKKTEKIYDNILHQ